MNDKEASNKKPPKLTLLDIYIILITGAFIIAIIWEEGCLKGFVGFLFLMVIGSLFSAWRTKRAKSKKEGLTKRFYKKQPFLFCNLLLLFVSLINIITIYSIYDPDISYIILLFTVLILIHCGIILFMFEILVGDKIEGLVPITKANLKIFYEKFLSSCIKERFIFVLNVFWLVVAITCFLLKVDSMNNAPFYIFKIQFFFSCATFLFGYACKYLLRNK